MFFLKFIFLTFFYVIFIRSSVAETKGWCERIVPSIRTRHVLKTRIEYITKQGWFRTFAQPQIRHYLAVEEETIYNTIRVCCPGYQVSKNNEDYNSYGSEEIESCEPICNRCPVKSICTAPNECRCNAEGYHHRIVDEKGQCEPICSKNCPKHSECFLPDQCKCIADYIADNGECLPGCPKGCPLNSKCTSPNECTCDEGFNMNFNESNCEPICYGDAGCPKFATCTALNECACNMEGYHQKVIKQNEYCEAICTINCPEYSECLAPEQCTCLMGYIELNGLCQPSCAKGCPLSSKCTAPNVCTCDEGFEFDFHKNECQPICYADLGGCPQNSFCSGPNQCTCNEDGYREEIITKNGHCEPICTKGCSAHGKCIAPERCECLPGYHLSTDGTMNCEPHCSTNCTNGFCFAPNTCVCHAGYLMGPNTICEPVCSLGCSNGQCIEPEICKCLEGFQMKANSVHECLPICEPKCKNADCVAPDVCICWQNYEPIRHSNKDDFNITSFTNLNLTSCTPTCPDGCLNGHCIQPSNCSCNSGYNPHSYIPNECVPVCEDCENGDCVEPGNCLCWPGYEARKSNDSKNERCYLMETSPSEPTITLSEFSSSTSIDQYSTEIPNDFRSTATAFENHKLCLDKCNCWALNSTSPCQSQCSDSDSNAESCISFEFCHCLPHNFLKCFHYDGQQQLLYNCRQSLPETLVNLSLFHNHNSQNKSSSNLIIYIILSILASTTAIGVILLLYKKLHTASYSTTGSNPNDLLVQYEK